MGSFGWRAYSHYSTLVEANGLLATYTVQQGLKLPDECGVATFHDAKELFDRCFRYPCANESHYSSHPFLYRDGANE